MSSRLSAAVAANKTQLGMNTRKNRSRFITVCARTARTRAAAPWRSSPSSNETRPPLHKARRRSGTSTPSPHAIDGSAVPAVAKTSLYVDAFPDFVLVHVPTLDRESNAGKQPDRWVFSRSKHPMLTIPEDGLPRHEGWAMTGEPVAA